MIGGLYKFTGSIPCYTQDINYPEGELRNYIFYGFSDKNQIRFNAFVILLDVFRDAKQNGFDDYCKMLYEDKILYCPQDIFLKVFKQIEAE